MDAPLTPPQARTLRRLADYDGVAVGWIPAAAMLPDAEIDVLCFWRGTPAHEIHAIAYMVAGSWFDSRTGERMDVPPTHWRNLPEPPP